jgi:hypothetical protein
MFSYRIQEPGARSQEPESRPEFKTEANVAVEEADFKEIFAWSQKNGVMESEK